MYNFFALVSALLAVVSGQQVGTQTAEVHPTMTWSTCDAQKSCTSTSGKVVLDANWRWLHSTQDTTNCYTGNAWDGTLCPDGATCATNCALDGADYTNTYGVTASGDSLKLSFVTPTKYGPNIGSRLYLMASDTSYEMFSLLDQEFTFDVDVSKLPCGLNGALYLVSMDVDGGTARYQTNKAGAQYGTGYCDAQCPRDLKFIDGQGNVAGWTNNAGNSGSCCTEMDIWEANSMSAAFTAHPCTPGEQTSCTGGECGDPTRQTSGNGFCDSEGCDFNSYRQGNTTFYGNGLIVDTNSPFTVVTRFIGNPLTEIKRFYVQNNKVIENSKSVIPNVAGNSITEGYCGAQKTAFGDSNTFDAKGGFETMSTALSKGMVLAMTLWDDAAAHELWLDSTFPTTSSKTGSARGSCSTSSGDPSDVEKNDASSYVIYSNIKVGPIGSTSSAP